MQEDSSSIIITLITMVLSFLGNCEVPETLVTPLPVVNDRRVEIVLAAPQASPSDASIVITVQVLEQRLAFLAAEVSAVNEGRFVVLLPSESLEQQDTVLSLATQQGRLRFHLVKEEAASKTELTPSDLEPTTFESHIVANAEAFIDDFGYASVGLNILSSQQEAFAQLTRDNIGRRLAIVFDDSVLIAPVIHSRLESRAVISGLASSDEAWAIARMIAVEPLPFALSVEAINIADP